VNYLKKLENELSVWPSVSSHAHRFGGKEFRFGSAAEVGHVHSGGIVDIPFTRSIRNALLENGLAGQHPWVPNSGWTRFQVRSEEDLKHALWLMRLSYLRYALKAAADPRKLFEQDSAALHLSPGFKSLLEKFVPSDANQFVVDRSAAVKA
jgi:Luciferase